jgi:hypothetical protein
MMAIIEKKPESRAVPEAVCGGDPGPGSPGAPAANRDLAMAFRLLAGEIHGRRLSPGLSN